MNVLPRWSVLLCLGLAMAFPLSPAAAGKFKVVHSFCDGHKTSCSDGSNPMGPLTADTSGNFYGTTSSGGRNGWGAVYEMVRSETGKFKNQTIFSFCADNNCVFGSNPLGALVIDTQGNLYGVASRGANNASGVIFELSRNSHKHGRNETVLHSFCSKSNCIDGAGPTAGLTYAGAASGVPYDGVSPLYGVTGGGGAHNAGTVFELTKSGEQWTETVLYSFCSQGGDKCLDGEGPFGRLALDENGNLFGTTSAGGGNNDGVEKSGSGVAFEISPDGDGWSQVVLYRFCSLQQCADGAGPQGDVILDSQGNLFGTTFAGGQPCNRDKGFGCGVAYEIIPNGTLSQEIALYAFCSKSRCRDGYGPQAGLILDSSGDLFGTTYFGGGNDSDVNGLGGGTVFEISGSTYKVLHSFCALANCADGEYPQATLTLDTSGQLFGTTSLGGEFGDTFDGGVIFQSKS